MSLEISKTHALAIAGGPRSRTSPFAPWPHFEEEEIEAAQSVLRSGKVNYWTGEQGRLFEQEYAAFTNRRHGVAVTNGTVALELALHALKIGSGDEVVVTSRSFVASASSVVLRGAIPIFADVDPNSQNITAETIRAVLSPRTKAIITVHLAGWPCDMDSILAVARERDIKVIEDCAQAHGATYKGRPVGSMGHVAIFSFCQDKIISTGGEGGMLLTNDDEIWERAWSYKDHGKNYAAVHKGQPGPRFRWVHDSVGTNWRITEVQTAIGRVLLRKVPDFLKRRRRNAAVLTEGFSRVPGLRLTLPTQEIEHAYYKYYVFIDPSKLVPTWNRDRVLEAINAEGIPCFVGSCSEIYRETAFSASMRPPKRLQVARELGETSLMFLVHPTLQEQDMLDACQTVEKVMRIATRNNTHLPMKYPIAGTGTLVRAAATSGGGAIISTGTTVPTANVGTPVQAAATAAPLSITPLKSAVAPPLLEESHRGMHRTGRGGDCAAETSLRPGASG